MNSDFPLVSILIPTYNHAHYLSNAIDSALRQDYPKVEIFVIDDGSTDSTPDVIQKYSGLIQYIKQANQGLSAARNTGINASNGSIVGLLDADDIWAPDYLSNMVPALTAKTDIGAAYSGFRYIDSAGKELPYISVRIVPIDQFYNTIAYMNFLVPSGVIIRRSCFDQLGLFDISLHACEDRDMWLRISSKYAMVGVPKALVYYRVHGENMTRNLPLMKRSRAAVVSKHFDSESGNLGAASDLRRLAYGGLYLRTAFDYLQADELETGYKYLRRAFSIYPELTGKLDVFYELACANQPLSVRGIAKYVDLERNQDLVFRALDEIFANPSIPEALEIREKMAYGYCHYAIGLLAYNRGDLRLARSHLFQALRHHKPLIKDQQLGSTIGKSMLGNLVVSKLKRIRIKLGLMTK